MKILTATLTLILTLAAGSVSFAQCPQSDCCGTHHCNACDNGSHAKRRHHNSNNDYLVSNFKVYYRGQVVEGATASSFSVIGEGYAKDNFRVFYNGQKIDGATASSFTLLGCGYAKDSFRVFYKGKKIDGATASSFVVLDNGYAKDNFNTYYKGNKI